MSHQNNYPGKLAICLFPRNISLRQQPLSLTGLFQGVFMAGYLHDGAQWFIMIRTAMATITDMFLELRFMKTETRQQP